PRGQAGDARARGIGEQYSVLRQETPMPTVWYVILAGILIGYAILDGFDLGAGILHLVVARTDRERRMVPQAIGPVWNGNEVWLIVWGGLLFLAFPRVYAVGFSGFYLALVIVLWLLMGR